MAASAWNTCTSSSAMELRLDFERPRNPELVTSPEFTRLKRHCLALLHPSVHALPLERLSPLGGLPVEKNRMTTLLNDDPALLQRLQADDSGIRRIALLDLADIAGEEHTPLFIAALRDPAAEVRVEAARALETWESPEGVAALAIALADGADAVRAAAAQTLSELKQPSSAAALLPHAAHRLNHAASIS
eukprot:gene39021-48190_t